MANVKLSKLRYLTMVFIRKILAHFSESPIEYFQPSLPVRVSQGWRGRCWLWVRRSSSATGPGPPPRSWSRTPRNQSPWTSGAPPPTTPETREVQIKSREWLYALISLFKQEKIMRRGLNWSRVSWKRLLSNNKLDIEFSCVKMLFPLKPLQIDVLLYWVCKIRILCFWELLVTLFKCFFLHYLVSPVHWSHWSPWPWHWAEPSRCSCQSGSWTGWTTAHTPSWE